MNRGYAAAVAALLTAALMGASCSRDAGKREKETVYVTADGKGRGDVATTLKNALPDDGVPQAVTAPATGRTASYGRIDPTHANAFATDRQAGARALAMAYPQFISKVDGNIIYFHDGSSMVYDDGRAKDWQTLLDDGDPEDMFFVPYDSRVSPPPFLSDPGRSRNEQLYKKMYGASAAAVQRNLVSVPWFGKSVQFTRVNGAADSLRKVEAEIKRYPELRKYVDSSGTFNWRPVRGAKRMSAHSYGIAFDIAVPYSDYWQWTLKTSDELADIPYKNRFPRKIVEIFERHGFIWGGAWYHYDTMHFEFRPELLLYPRLRRG